MIPSVISSGRLVCGFDSAQRGKRVCGLEAKSTSCLLDAGRRVKLQITCGVLDGRPVLLRQEERAGEELLLEHWNIRCRWMVWGCMGLGVRGVRARGTQPGGVREASTKRETVGRDSFL